MSTSTRLTEIFKTAPEIPFSDSSKIILLSDCHRGTNDWIDDFAPNQSLYYYAIKHYFENDFTYIEVGDGDELWENRDFSEIRQAHSSLFRLLKLFYDAGRLHFIWGNHDIERRDPQNVEKNLYH